jgi:hypothetical protein
MDEVISVILLLLFFFMERHKLYARGCQIFKYEPVWGVMLHHVTYVYCALTMHVRVSVGRRFFVHLL